MNRCATCNRPLSLAWIAMWDYCPKCLTSPVNYTEPEES